MRFEVKTMISISDDPIEMFACNPPSCLGRADRGTTLPRGYDVRPEPRPVHIA